jgi:hypothetical protein
VFLKRRRNIFLNEKRGILGMNKFCWKFLKFEVSTAPTGLPDGLF